MLCFVKQSQKFKSGEWQFHHQCALPFNTVFDKWNSLCANVIQPTLGLFSVVQRKKFCWRGSSVIFEVVMTIRMTALFLDATSCVLVDRHQPFGERMQCTFFSQVATIKTPYFDTALSFNYFTASLIQCSYYRYDIAVFRLPWSSSGKCHKS